MAPCPRPTYYTATARKVLDLDKQAAEIGEVCVVRTFEVESERCIVQRQVVMPVPTLALVLDLAALGHLEIGVLNISNDSRDVTGRRILDIFKVRALKLDHDDTIVLTACEGC